MSTAVGSTEGGSHGIAKPYRFLYRTLLIGSAVSVMLNLFFLVMIYGPVNAFKITLGISVMCLCVTVVPFVPFAVRWRRTTGHLNMRTALNAYSWRKAGWVDRVITLALFALIFVSFAFFIGHGQRYFH
jgi:hypothetical protein